jgi:hypothetical protein
MASGALLLVLCMHHLVIADFHRAGLHAHVVMTGDACAAGLRCDAGGELVSITVVRMKKRHATRFIYYLTD